MRPIVLVLVGVIGCGGASVTQKTYDRLREMQAAPIESASQSEEHSRFLDAALQNAAFSNMDRAQVEARIGKGDDCARHPECARQGFGDQDWFYTLGARGSNHAPPILIIGFSATGHVERTWNLRTH